MFSYAQDNNRGGAMEERDKAFTSCNPSDEELEAIEQDDFKNDERFPNDDAYFDIPLHCSSL